MNNNLTDVTIILDKSGSMASVLKDTIDGFNTFLEEQKKIPGHCNITLVTFDSVVHKPTIEAKPINAADKLSVETYRPGGFTALLDAIGDTILKNGKRFLEMSESERPGKVVMVVITDGEENASREYKHADVMKMIKHQQEIYKWDFVYLGANQDAIQVGAQYGFAGNKSMSYAANSIGTQSVFRSTASYVGKTRLSADASEVAAVSFTAGDRNAQTSAGAKP